jgi:hypothetical protein
MNGKYWLANLPGTGLVLYDPAIQDDEADFVRLFVVKTQELRNFDRAQTRGKVKAVKDEAQYEKAVNAYASLHRQGDSGDVTPPSTLDVSASLGATLAKQLADLTELLTSTQTNLNRRNSDYADLKRAAEDLSAALEASVAEVAELKSELETLRQEKYLSDLEKLDLLSRQAALYASGTEADFRRILQHSKLDGSLPLVLATKLEVHLRVALDELNPAYKLFDLVKMAQEQGLLNDEAIDMAHIVRKQRNAFAHNKAAQTDATARILISLYAAALLWPNLST